MIERQEDLPYVGHVQDAYGIGNRNDPDAIFALNNSFGDAEVTLRYFLPSVTDFQQKCRKLSGQVLEVAKPNSAPCQFLKLPGKNVNDDAVHVQISKPANWSLDRILFNDPEFVPRLLAQLPSEGEDPYWSRELAKALINNGYVENMSVIVPNNCEMKALSPLIYVGQSVRDYQRYIAARGIRRRFLGRFAGVINLK